MHEVGKICLEVREDDTELLDFVGVREISIEDELVSVV